MLFLIGCASSSPPTTQPALVFEDLWAIRGGQEGGRAGMSADFAGDLDGDGRDELIIGAPYVDGVGAVWVVAGQDEPDGVLSLANEAIGLYGTAPGDAAGFTVSGAGDVDGDGLDDILVGAWGEDSIGTDAGMVWLISGPITASGRLEDAGTAFPGEYSYDNAGFAVAGAGDTDGDGLADLLIGAPFHDEGGSRAGTAFLHTDTETILLSGSRPGDELGHSLSSGGDFNGDGLSDVIVGAWRALDNNERPGAAYIWLGPLSGTLSARTADHILFGAEDGDRAGTSVADVGDVDGDGRDDVAVGSMVGRAWLVVGRGEGEAQRLEADRVLDGLASALVGAVVAGGGDLDGDGHSEILLGAPGWDQPEINTGGFAVVYGGGHDIEQLDREWWSMAGAGSMASISLAGGGDVDGDGRSDLLIGGQGGGLDREGMVWLLPGSAW